MRAFSLPILLVLAGLGLFGPLVVPAQATYTWVAFGFDNNWSDADNWRTGGGAFPYPGATPFDRSSVLFTTRLQPIGFVQGYNVRVDRDVYLTNITFDAVPDPEVPNAHYTLTVSEPYRLYVTDGITATTTADAADFQVDGVLGFAGSVTVNNLTGHGIISTSLASGTLTQLGPAGSYTGMISNGGDLDDGNPPLYTTSLTVGDGMQTASLTLSPPNVALNPNKYSGTTLVKANATLVSGVGDGLSARSAHVIDGTLSLAGGSSTVKSLAGAGTVGLGANALTITSGGTTFDGTITGTGGSILKAGAGTLTLTGNNTNTGTTTISGGGLDVNGSIAGGAVVQTGAALGGTGTIGGAVTVQSGGTLSPGNSPGQLTLLGDLTLDAGSLLEMEFSGATSGLFDQLDVRGIFAAGGTLQLTIDAGYTPVFGTSFPIFNGPTPGYDSGSFIITTNLGDGLFWNTSALASTGMVSVVPEPSTSALVIAGLLGAAILLRLPGRSRASAKAGRRLA